MRHLTPNSLFKVIGVTAVIVLGVAWTASRVRPSAQAQGIAAPPLPLTIAYFYGPVSVSENHMVKMCSTNLFGDGSVRFVAAIINAADGRVLKAQEMSLEQRGGECLTFEPGASRDLVPAGSLDLLAVLWSRGSTWGESNWSSARASGPLASLQLIDVAEGAGNRVIAILSTPGKVTVDSRLLPAIQ
jgi:hypothetical protein